jgi:hypothetical protein
MEGGQGARPPPSSFVILSELAGARKRTSYAVERSLPRKNLVKPPNMSFSA